MQMIMDHCVNVEKVYKEKCLKVYSNKGSEYIPHLNNIKGMIQELDIMSHSHQSEIGKGYTNLIKIQKTPFITINKEFEKKTV